MCATAMIALEILSACHNGPTGGQHGGQTSHQRSLTPGFFCPPTIKIPTSLSKRSSCNVKKKLHNVMRLPQNSIKFVKSLTLGIDIWALFPSSRGNNYISRGESDYLSNGLKRRHSPPMKPSSLQISGNLSSQIWCAPCNHK
ncbi:hypothetical protein Tco_1210941 [Tanacetum coccineum]